MAFDETFDVTNPAELAQPFAIDLSNHADYYEPKVTALEETTRQKINEAVGYLGLRGTYLVEAGLAWITRPHRLTTNTKKSVGDVPNLTFEGNFFEYEIVKLGGADVEQQRTIRSLCLTFTDATLLPFFDKLTGDNLVYVPVFAVDDIIRTS